MRANEFILEDKKGNKDQLAAMTNVGTFPDQNMYHGSGYNHSKFLRALAGAGAGNTESVNMTTDNMAEGDPIFSPYHPVEEEMLNNAAKAIGDKSKKQWSGKKSTEPEGTHKVSPVTGFKGFKKK